MHTPSWLPWLSLVLVFVSGGAQPSWATPPRMAATFTKQAPVIDGRLNESSWLRAERSSAFVQKSPQGGAAPSEPTFVRVLYDEESLYIGIECPQQTVPIIARMARRDQQVESDWVQVTLVPKQDGATAFQFTVNAAAVLGDGVLYNGTEYSPDWDTVFDAATQRSATGWSAEIAVPLRGLRIDSAPLQEWGFQVRRYISMKQELDEWVFIPRTVAGEIAHYGRLTELRGLRHKHSFEARPFLIGRVNFSDMAAPGARLVDPSYKVSGGLDLKWHLSRSLTLNLALNPDFSQVEVDQVLLNLTSYENFLTEKRPFFLEGLDVFQTPMQLFYSRRIGMVPDAPALLDGERMLSAPEPATIYGASKLSGSLGPHLTLGLLSTVTARDDVATRLHGRSPSARLALPLTAYNVLRLRYALAENTHVGLLAAAVNRFEPTQDYPLLRDEGPPTVLCPSGDTVPLGSRCFHDSYVVGLDGLWRSKNGEYVISGQAIVSGIKEGPMRLLRDGTPIRSGDVAPGGRVYLAKEGGQWLGSIEFEGLGRTVDYNDIGFMRRQNLLRLLVAVDYRTVVPFGKVLETRTHLAFSYRRNLDGLTLWQGYYLWSEWRFRNFWVIGGNIYHYGSRFDDREIGDGTALEHAPLVGLDFWLSSDPRRALTVSLSTETQVLWNGFNFTLSGTVSLQVLPQLQIALLPQALYTFGEPRYIGQGINSREYLFGRLSASNLGVALRASYIFTPRLSVQLYSQLFLAAKHYYDFSSYLSGTSSARSEVRLDELQPTAAPTQNPDSVETALNVNFVLRWEFMPGSTLFAVYTRSQSPVSVLQEGERAALDIAALRRGPSADTVIIKFSYFWN